MSNEFVKPVPYSGEEDGTFNHEQRLTRGEAALREQINTASAFKNDPYIQIYANRVIVFCDNVVQAKVVQARLPEYFHGFDPLPFEFWIENGGRPEPFRITYITKTCHEMIKGKSKTLYIMPYSVIELTSQGRYIELRDQTSTKWGRNNGKSRNAPDLILSEQVLNGEVTL